MKSLGMLSAKKMPDQAFTLVEVVMAIGVLSVAVIPLLGLLASGLTASRANLDRAIGAQICNWVQSDIRSQSNAYTAQFDEFGTCCTTNAAAANAPYLVTITPKPVLLPGGSLTLGAWEVAIKQTARGNQAPDKKIVWGTQ